MYKIIQYLNFEKYRNVCPRYMENCKKSRDWKKRESRSARGRRETEKGSGTDPSTGIRTPRALPGEDVQRLYPRARRIRVTGMFLPVSRPRGLPCFILVYPVMRSLPCRLYPRCSRLAFFPPFSFNRNVMCRSYERRKSA